MQIGDIFHMFAKLSKTQTGGVMSEEKYRRMIENVKAMNLPDVVIN